MLCIGFGNFLLVARVQMLLAIVANLGSVYLFYILFFVLRDTCVVCISSYVVNFALLLCAHYRISNLKQLNFETGGPIIYGGQTKKRV